MVSQNKDGNQNCHYFTNNSILPVLNLKVIGLISLLCIVFCAISYTMMYTPTSQRRLRARILVRKSKDFTANNSWIFTESNETRHITTDRNSVDFTSSTLKPESKYTIYYFLKDNKIKKKKKTQKNRVNAKLPS